MKEYSWKNRRQRFLSAILLLVIWEIAAIKINNSIYLPRIREVVVSMGEILSGANFVQDVVSSLYRTLISFVVALILAIILGVLSKQRPYFKNLLAPLNAIGKTIPTMVLVLLALIWFDKDKAPYVVGFAIVFPILYEGIINSLNSIDIKLMDMCKIYGVKTKEKINKIYIPVIFFYIVNILLSTFSLAFKVVVAGEVHGQPKYGIGSSIQLAKMNFDTTAIFAWIILIALMSVLLEWVNKIIVVKFNKWK